MLNPGVSAFRLQMLDLVAQSAVYANSGRRQHGLGDRVTQPAQACQHVFVEIGPLLESRLRDVGAPGSHLREIVLQGRQMTAEVAHPGRQPEARVAARGADLEHLTVPLWRHEPEEELSCRAGDGS